jgi:hypothetical protein
VALQRCWRNSARQLEFLRQRLSSDYCAVYAVAMWLSFMGRPTTRAESHLAFGTRRRGWVPPDEAAVAAVLHRLLDGMPVSTVTRQYSSAAAFVAASKRRLKLSRALLVAATCRLRAERVTARHAFVVTGCGRGSLRILDTLGPAPSLSPEANASVDASTANKRYVPVAGARWDLDLSRPVVFIGGSL